ncbi:MAG: hypothetical protein CMB32_01465 [Euryarchaeota archaeon]|nr:hypothetical protein [Euryarchaeota archaeon]|tara:strand:+ start:1308 stop:2429 length:1122 start_codon:yes stop_codon:yes gene_type:complete
MSNKNRLLILNNAGRVFRPVFILPILAVIFHGCGSGSSDNSSSFDRSSLLSNYCDNIIIPGYEDFYNKSIQLHESVVLYSEGTSTLQDCREQLYNSYLSWQRVMPFAFGPAYNNLLNVSVNTYPTDASQIEQDILNGIWNPPTSDFDHFGLPAIDYLLNFKDQHDSDELVRLQQLTSHLVDLSSEVYNNWNDAYGADFKSSTGTELGSSISQLLNSFNQVYEQNVRKQKLGLPVGISGAIDIGNSLPDKVEAFYANTYSIDLLYEALLSFQDLYNGDYYLNEQKIEGLGLDDYLISLGEEEYGSELDDDIQNQVEVSLAAISTLSSPLSEYVVSNRDEAISVYIELQALVVLWKVDMMGSLGVLVTYADNDGD